MEHLEPTPQEAKIIKELKAIARRWPKSLWLFSGSGSLWVMRAAEDGGQVHTAQGGIDHNHILDSINIPNDGGDWD